MPLHIIFTKCTLKPSVRMFLKVYTFSPLELYNEEFA